MGNLRKHRADGLNLLSGKGGSIRFSWGRVEAGPRREAGLFPRGSGGV